MFAVDDMIMVGAGAKLMHPWLGSLSAGVLLERDCWVDSASITALNSSKGAIVCYQGDDDRGGKKSSSRECSDEVKQDRRIGRRSVSKQEDGGNG